MKLNIYRLTFKTPLHISDLRSEYSKSEKRIHSDTLYAAIMHAWSMLGKNEWISKDPPFTISSLFPFATDINSNFIYFFPKPYVLPIKEEDKKPEIAKKFKKVQYLDKNYFEKLLNGVYDPSPESLKGEYLTDKIFKFNNERDSNLVNNENKYEIIKSQIVPRIKWNRKENEESEPFYMEKLFFDEGTGFWFIIFFESNEILDRFEIALNLLSDEGLGTDRNVGNGKFNFESDVIELNIPEESNYCINLSLYCPESYEVLKNHLISKEENNGEIDPNVGYDFIKRGGWISEPYNTYRKREIYMFTEGSVFRYEIRGCSVMGASHDVTPEIILNKEKHHRIYRTGKALFLPIKFI